MEEEKQYVSLPWFGIPKLLPHLRGFGKLFFWMITMGLYGGFMDIVIPLFQKTAINRFVALSDLSGLWAFAGLYAAALLSQVVANYISAYGASKAEMWVDRDLRRVSFSHLQTLSFSFFNHNSVGYIHARIMSDVSRIGELVSWSLMDAIWNVSYIVGAVAVMLALDWRLALWVLAVVPLAAAGAAFFQKKLVFYNRKVRDTNSRITSSFNEGIMGAKTIKTLVIEDKVGKEFDGLTGKMRHVSVRAMHYRSLFMSVMAFAASLALALALWRGGLITAQGVMLIGTLSVFMNYAQGMMDPIQHTVQVFSNLIHVQVNLERFTRLMETQSDVRDSPEVVEKYGDTFTPKRENWEELGGDVVFDDVSFRYPDGDDFVLEHFDLKVPQGTNVAIVGETGAGKSTLVNLICRFFEPTEGRILIDGRDVRERSQLWLHSHIGYVLQTPHLFSGTVLENLLYGRPDATMEQVKAAVRAVSAEYIIDRLPDGYDSEVGEGGSGLSTGEKQLLSFARAILADPRIFVLDEATSSVDTVTEHLIQDAIATLMQGRTSFVIAHRLSTIRRADIILVVHDGQITESGNHRQLMDKKGAYWNLYTRQYREAQLRASLEGLAN